MRFDAVSHLDQLGGQVGGLLGEGAVLTDKRIRRRRTSASSRASGSRSRRPGWFWNDVGLGSGVNTAGRVLPALIRPTFGREPSPG